MFATWRSIRWPNKTVTNSMEQSSYGTELVPKRPPEAPILSEVKPVNSKTNKIDFPSFSAASFFLQAPQLLNSLTHSLTHLLPCTYWLNYLWLHPEYWKHLLLVVNCLQQHVSGEFIQTVTCDVASKH
jgi:hypothetical protein